MFGMDTDLRGAVESALASLGWRYAAESAGGVGAAGGGLGSRKAPDGLSHDEARPSRDGPRCIDVSVTPSR